MEGMPSLTIEGNTLLIRTTFKEIAYYRKSPLLLRQTIKEIPYLIRKSLTIEGNPLHEISKQTVEGNPLLCSKGFPPTIRGLTT